MPRPMTLPIAAVTLARSRYYHADLRCHESLRVNGLVVSVAQLKATQPNAQPCARCWQSAPGGYQPPSVPEPWEVGGLI